VGADTDPRLAHGDRKRDHEQSVAAPVRHVVADYKPDAKPCLQTSTCIVAGLPSAGSSGVLARSLHVEQPAQGRRNIAFILKLAFRFETPPANTHVRSSSLMIGILTNTSWIRPCVDSS
jgi:hypothetical protein